MMDFDLCHKLSGSLAETLLSPENDGTRRTPLRKEERPSSGRTGGERHRKRAELLPSVCDRHTVARLRTRCVCYDKLKRVIALATTELNYWPACIRTQDCRRA